MLNAFGGGVGAFTHYPTFHSAYMDPTLLQRLYGNMMQHPNNDSKSVNPQDLRSSMMLSNPIQQMAVASALQKLQGFATTSPIHVSDLKSPSHFNLLRYNFNPVLTRPPTSNPFISRLGFISSSSNTTLPLKPNVLSKYQQSPLCSATATSNSILTHSSQ